MFEFIYDRPSEDSRHKAATAAELYAIEQAEKSAKRSASERVAHEAGTFGNWTQVLDHS